MPLSRSARCVLMVARLSSTLLPPLATHLLVRSLPPLFGSSPSHLHTHTTALVATTPLLALLPRGGDVGSAVVKWLLAAMCAAASSWVRAVGQRSDQLGVTAGPIVAWAGIGILSLLSARNDFVSRAIGHAKRSSAESVQPTFGRSTTLRPHDYRPPRTIVGGISRP